MRRLVPCDWLSLTNATWDDGGERRVARFDVSGQDEPQREVRVDVYVGRGAAVPLRCSGVPDVIAGRVPATAIPLRRDAWSTAMADERDRVTDGAQLQVALIDGAVVVLREGDDADVPVRAALAIAAGLEAIAPGLPSVDEPERPNLPPPPFVAPPDWRKEAWWAPAPTAVAGPDAVVLHRRNEVAPVAGRHLMIARPSSFDPALEKWWGAIVIERAFGDPLATPHHLWRLMGAAAGAVEGVWLHSGAVIVMGVDDPTGARDGELIAAADAVAGAGPPGESPGVASTLAYLERNGHRTTDLADGFDHYHPHSGYEHWPKVAGDAFVVTWWNVSDGAPVGRLVGPGNGVGLTADPGTDPVLLSRVVAQLSSKPCFGRIEVVATPDLVWLASRLTRRERQRTERFGEHYAHKALFKAIVS